MVVERNQKDEENLPSCLCLFKGIVACPSTMGDPHYKESAWL